MADMQALAGLMHELEDQLIVCMRCGMCQAVCPLYGQTGREADVARGKLALLDGLLQEMFDRPESVRERLDRCLLCGSCQANCPSGVRVVDIFLKARAILALFGGLSTPQKLIFKGLLAHPALFDTLLFWSAKLQKLLTRPVNELLGTSCARLEASFLAERHFKTLSAEPFHRALPGLDTPAGSSGKKAALFVGCLIDKIFPHIAHAVVEVCRRSGIGLYIPQNQGCCGIPALSAGDTDTFHRLVSHNVDRFSAARFDVLLTACATCTATIRHIWPMMLREESSGLRGKALTLAARTFDVSAFLVDQNLLPPDRLSAGSPDPPQAVTYHDPCHLKKSLGVFSQPRALIGACRGYALKEMRAADQCCGMGGSFNLKHYALSSRIGKDKGDAIRDSGCRIVATSCPACMLQISDVLSRAGDDLAVRHVIELYAESLK